MSASLKAASIRSNSATRPLYCCAVISACARVRLLIATSRTPLITRLRRACCPISPDPMTNARHVDRSPNVLFASSTATELTEAALRLIAVSVRARFPTVTARLNSFSTTLLPAFVSRATSYASRTCPRISFSPTTKESSPQATEKRCLTASSPR